MDETIIGSALVAGTIIALAGVANKKPVMRPLFGVLSATFLLAGLAVAGAPQIASPLAQLGAGTVVVIYAPDVFKVLAKV